MNIKEEIIKLLNKKGISEIGFIKADKFSYCEEILLKKQKMQYDSEFEKEYKSPFFYMNGCKTIISVAFPYFKENNENEFSIYTKSNDYHIIVKKIFDPILDLIKSKGYEAKGFVDNNRLNEKYIAAVAGIGKIGKNSLLYNSKYGSYFFIGEILTDCEMITENMKFLQSPCGSCNKCIDMCPGNAISNKSFLNSRNCISYITQKKKLSKNELYKIKNRVWGCDICQKACPLNVNIEKSYLNEFDSLDHMDNVDLYKIVKMTNIEFERKYKKQSCGWRGKNILIRNALNVLYNKLEKDKFLKEFKKDDYKSPVILDFFDRLL